jgi:hypothetical protein
MGNHYDPREHNALDVKCTAAQLDAAIMRRAANHAETQAAAEALSAAGYDKINPTHYRKHPSGVECITVTEHMPFNLGNAVKYIWRAGEKPDANTVDDLKKAAWYVNREIERLGGKP